jgi:hypothetical protein
MNSFNLLLAWSALSLQYGFHPKSGYTIFWAQSPNSNEAKSIHCLTWAFCKSPSPNNSGLYFSAKYNSIALDSERTPSSVSKYGKVPVGDFGYKVFLVSSSSQWTSCNSTGAPEASTT